MILAFPHTHTRGRVAALGLTLAVHTALYYGWRMSMNTPAPDDGAAVDRIQWLLVPEPARIVQPPVRQARPVAPAVRRPRAAPQGKPARAVAAPSPAPSFDEAVAPPAPAAPSVLEQARSSVGAIDRNLRKANPNRFIQAPVITAQMRMQRGIAQAKENAPNRWYEAPKVTEIIDPGGYGRRRYKVITARGTYCVTYEKNHAPDGIDSMQHGIKPKLTTCPPDEQEATRQDWDPKF